MLLPTTTPHWGGALRDDTKNGCVADYVGDGNLDFRSQKSHFENFSWKLKFDLKVQKSYFGNHNLVLGYQKFHFDSQKVI